MLNEDQIVAATYGSEYIPFFRKRRRQWKSEISHSEVMNLVKNSEWHKWDFVTSLGDTIREKYESLYAEIRNLWKEMEDLNIDLNWFITSPEISCVFETSRGFQPVYTKKKDDIIYKGNLYMQFRIYCDYNMPNDVILLTDSKMTKGMCLNIENFVY